MLRKTADYPYFDLRARQNKTPHLMLAALTKYLERRFHLCKPLIFGGIHQLRNRMIAFHHIDLAAISANQDGHGISGLALRQSHIFRN